MYRFFIALLIGVMPFQASAHDDPEWEPASEWRFIPESAEGPALAISPFVSQPMNYPLNRLRARMVFSCDLFNKDVIAVPEIIGDKVVEEAVSREVVMATIEFDKIPPMPPELLYRSDSYFDTKQLSVIFMHSGDRYLRYFISPNKMRKLVKWTSNGKYKNHYLRMPFQDGGLNSGLHKVDFPIPLKNADVTIPQLIEHCKKLPAQERYIGPRNKDGTVVIE